MDNKPEQGNDAERALASCKIENSLLSDAYFQLKGMIQKLEESKEEQLANSKFMEDLDRVNQAIQKTPDFNGMMNDVLKEVLSIFDCDRAWFFYPCDPDSPTFRVPMEVTKPEYPGANALNTDIPMPPDMVQNLREALASAVPVTYVAGTEKVINKLVAEQFSVKSQMFMTLRPKVGGAWVFGVHQCSRARVWTVREQALFNEIGGRITDSLTGTLQNRDIQKKNRTLRMLSGVNRELVRATDEMSLMNNVSKIVVDIGGYHMLWIGFAEQDEAKTVRPVAQTGFGTDYLSYAKISWADDERGRGPTGTAIRTGTTQVARDILNDPRMTPWRAAAVERGYKSSIALPLGNAGGQFGVLSIYSSNTDAFDDGEVAVLEEISKGLAFGITTLRAGAERKEAEASLKKFKLVAEAASDQIVITDSEGVILYVNKGAERITGFSREESIGKTSALWGKQMSKEFYEDMWRTIKDEKKSFSAELVNRRKNGERYDADISISPTLDDSGKIQYFLGVERDITKLKEADRAKSEFVSLASHQLRTPITVINWYTEMLLAGDAGELGQKQKEFFEKIYAASQQMNEILKSFLYILHIETGGVALNSVLTNTKDLVERVLKEFSLALEKKSIHVIEECHDVQSSIYIDPEIIQVVFRNLISNAIKYTQQEGELRLSCEFKSKGSLAHRRIVEGDSLLITVRDNGIGIPEKEMSDIFKKFHRAENAKMLDPNGNGLGLYIVQKMMNIAGGSIWIESEEGKGTTFYVLFPVGEKKPAIIKK